MVCVCNIEVYICGKFKVFDFDIIYFVEWGVCGIEVKFVIINVWVVDVIELGYNIIILIDK